jgi:hypothetical protein
VQSPGGAEPILIVWAAKQVTQLEVSPELASASTTILAFLAGYITPRPKEQ